MATANAGTVEASNVPQWKRDLIQRRRQQSKVLASNGASVKLCSAVIGTADEHQEYCCPVAGTLRANDGAPLLSSSLSSSRRPTGGAIVAAAADSTVAHNMRLEADLSLCSDDASDTSERKPSEYSEETDGRMSGGENVGENAASRETTTKELSDSDSSEELQYGPGIVNKLKSKYLNLTLRETNGRASVQRFRRAASLEDLLDRDDDEAAAPEKTARKYAKRDEPGPPPDRYRNASRGNESMKRARSVETLMRYNTADEAHRSNGLHQEPVNDHIILVDRTSVKIENRLGEPDRPKPINKPKRIRPVLAETERPPPDLVRTTMRIFEGSAKKLKPKGEVAAKVATFKTINDTFKAKKPPVQPKPFLNGTARSKRIVLPHKPPTAELISEEEYLPIAVSSVVSKFEKSHSPSPSPEPYQKFKFSPANSPELSKLEIAVKSPPATPVLSSPRLQSPPSQKPPREAESSPEFTAEQPLLFESSERKDDATRLTENAEEGIGPRTISKNALDNIGRAGTTMQFNFGDKPTSNKSYLPKRNGQKFADEPYSGDVPLSIVTTSADEKPEEKEDVEEKPIVPESKPIGAICSLGLIKPVTSASYPQNNNEAKRCQKSDFSPPQKQIGIIRPLVSTKTQQQQNLSNRELEKNLINRVKSIEQPTKVVVSLKSADEIQPAKKTAAGGGLWDTKPWNQQNNTMVFNFSNRKDVPDYIENDGLIIRRKREKPKVGDGGIIVLDATLDASTTDEAEWEISGGPPSPCDVSFLNDNVLINGRSNLSRTPRNHKHRIQFDDTATRTFEYPSEASILEGESSGAETSVEQQSTASNNKTSSTAGSTSIPSLLGGSGLASYTPSKVDLTSEGFELGVTRAVPIVVPASAPTGQTTENEVDYLRPAQDAGAWGSETTGDLLY
ncbi:PREDICTED: uncharacterized protein LOC106742968 [Dinoponera quadriceps]|uniref:Uncharacterized protein LOC106742968 n=1 Tax=Dinoponera quadriceps TaxID=609295 RepID=A0A6P3X0G2_DINQU|nr:PREDICTED: uncharacterized protein LOC106742968 [Dinoponera quadriceps]